MIKKMAVVFLMIFLAGVAKAGDAEYSFGYEIVKNASGNLTLKITTTVASGGLWLGVTAYPPNLKNAAKEASNQVFPVKQGRGIAEIDIDPKFVNGTFEAAVWTKKVSKDDCQQTDELCQRLGYRLSGVMLSYVWGYLTAP